MYLDAGDLLFKAPLLPAAAGRPAVLDRARLIARAVGRMGPGAVNVGRLDLAAGVAFLASLGQEFGVPWVSTNLKTAAGEYPFPRWRVVTWGGLRLGVLGVLPPAPGRDPDVGIAVDDPVVAVREGLAALERLGVDAVVCLSNLGLDRERALAREVAGLWVVVGGGTSEYLATPRREGDTLILHAGNRGRYLGLLETTPASVAGWKAPLDLAERIGLEGRLSAARDALARMGPGREGDPRKRAELERQVAWSREQLDRLAKATVVFRHRILALDAPGGEDEEIARWVRDWKGRVSAAVPPRSAGRSAAVAPLPPSSPVGRPVFTGSARCRGCHERAYRRWASTRHARSYRSLADKPGAQECASCHGGRLERADGLVVEPVVGCELCHGPGGNHRTRANIVRRPGPDVCRRCHRGVHDEPPFDPPAAFRAIRCDRDAGR